MKELLKSAGEFLFVYVIVRGIIVHWLANEMIRVSKRYFIISERDLAIFLHYRNKAMNNNHRHKTPVECDDERCITI